MNHKEPKYGSFLGKNNNGRTVVLEWHQADILSSQLASFKKEVSGFAARLTAQSEVEFLRANPQAVSTGGFFHGCQPLFTQGIDSVDWDAVQETVQLTIKQFYLIDISLFGSEVINKLKDDLYFCVSIKDQQTGKLLGFMMAAITPALPIGDIKIINVIIAPEEQGNALERLLLSTIVKVMPEIKRMFTVVRSTNSTALKTLKSCGFEKDLKPVQDPNHIVKPDHWVAMEYRVDRSDILQKTSAELSV